MGDTGARRVRRVALAGTLVAAAACGGGGGGDGGSAGGPGRAGGDPVPLAGETAQGMRLHIGVEGDRRIRLRMTVDCEVAGRSDAPPEERANAVSLERHPLEAEVDGDGRFTVDESYVEAGTDGDEEHVDVRVDGAFAPDGTASGTVEVLSRQWNGQGEDFGPDCETGTVDWSAGEPARPEDGDVVVALAAELTAADGDDLVAVTPAGDVARVTPAGEARRLDGTTLASPTTTAPPGGGTTPPVTAIAPDGVWAFSGLAVADGGLWMTDPAAGVLSRTELADGRRTATTGVAVESVAAGEGGLWTLWNDEPAATYRLQRRDPVTGEVLASAPVTMGRPAAGPSAVWFAYRSDTGRVDRVDPATAAPAESHPVDAELPGERTDDGMVVGADRVWLLTWAGLTALDPATGEAAPVDLPTAPSAVAATADGRGAWTAHPRERVIRRVAAGGRVELTVDVPEGRWRPVVTADGAVWLTGGTGDDDQRVVRVDPAATGG
jgi:hypothetical protein